MLTATTPDPTRQTPPAGPAPTSPRPTVLIVDDVPANLGVLLDCLDEAGFDVPVAESGKGALHQLAYAQPDIILLDVAMPGALDGFATCRRLKTEPRWQPIPVLFLSALTEPVDKVRGFEAGGVDFISKPMNPKEVLARVRAHLQIRALQVAVEEKNALLRPAIVLRREAEAQLQQSLDRAVLVVRGQARVEFCTRLARRLLERYFPDQRNPDVLPAPLAAWVADRPSRPWRGERGDTRLDARLFAEGPATGDCFMLLEESLRPNAPADFAASLLQPGLTAREAEVLYWTVPGKTSPEIATILDAAPNTVKKHVGHILLKLGVETCLPAALRAVEILGLPGVDPTKFRGED